MVLRNLTLSIAMIGAVAAATAGDARPPRDREQEAAMRGLQQGRILPLRAIEAMIVPRMRGFDYLGPEFDPGELRYRLKFIRQGRVVWIDVDARTGQIVGHSGN
jgi:uncharacterized membrane protein YkoI